MYQCKFVREMQKPKWITVMGGINEVPEPLEEIPEDEFWYGFMTWLLNYIECRQINMRGGFTSAMIFWFWNEGRMIVAPDHWGIRNNRCYYIDKPKFYRLGCRHEWKAIVSTMRGEHHDRCKKCGLDRHYDSSD